MRLTARFLFCAPRPVFSFAANAFASHLSVANNSWSTLELAIHSAEHAEPGSISTSTTIVTAVLRAVPLPLPPLTANFRVQWQPRAPTIRKSSCSLGEV